MNPNPFIHKFTLLLIPLVIMVIGLGAWTRLVDAGLGCPDWPTCYGFIVPPTTDEQKHIANSRYPETAVDDSKTWPEMIHRYFAAPLLGFVVFGLLGYCIKNRASNNPPLKHCLLLSIVIVLQALFGMWTVTLKLWPQVVTAHLLGGFLTFALLVLLAYRTASTQSIRISKTPFITALLPASLALLTLQIAVGGWLSSNYAAIACPDFPQCQAAWLPEADYIAGFNIFQDIGPNYLGGKLEHSGRVAIHFTHRILALLLGVLLFLTSFRLYKEAQPSFTGILLAALTTLQISLGIANVLFHLPLFIAISHNLVAAFLFCYLVVLNYTLYQPPQKSTAQ